MNGSWRQLKSLKHDKLSLQCGNSLVMCHLVLQYTAHGAAQGRRGRPRRHTGKRRSSATEPTARLAVPRAALLAQLCLLFVPHPSSCGCLPRRWSWSFTSFSYLEAYIPFLDCKQCTVFRLEMQYKCSCNFLTNVRIFFPHLVHFKYCSHL